MRRLLGLLFLLISLQGCIPPSHLPEKRLNPEEVLDLIEKPGASGFGTFYIRSGHREVRGHASVVGRSDGSFRIDVVDPFLRPIYTILYHGEDLTFLSLREDRLYMDHLPINGRINIEGVSISPLSGIALILGFPPLKDVVIEGGRMDGHFYRLRLKGGGFIYRITVDLKNGYPGSLAVYGPSGNLLYSQRNTFSKDGSLTAVEGKGQGMVVRFSYTRWKVEEPEDAEFSIPDSLSP